MHCRWRAWQLYVTHAWHIALKVVNFTSAWDWGEWQHTRWSTGGRGDGKSHTAPVAAAHKSSLRKGLHHDAFGCHDDVGVLDGRDARWRWEFIGLSGSPSVWQCSAWMAVAVCLPCSVSVWQYASLAVCLCGSVSLWQCVYLAVRLSSSVSVWLSFCRIVSL